MCVGSRKHDFDDHPDHDDRQPTRRQIDPALRNKHCLAASGVGLIRVVSGVLRESKTFQTTASVWKFRIRP